MNANDLARENLRLLTHIYLLESELPIQAGAARDITTRLLQAGATSASNGDIIVPGGRSAADWVCNTLPLSAPHLLASPSPSQPETRSYRGMAAGSKLAAINGDEPIRLGSKR